MDDSKAMNKRKVGEGRVGERESKGKGTGGRGEGRARLIDTYILNN